MSNLNPPVVDGGLPVLGHAVEYLNNPIGLLERGYREHGQAFTIKLGPKNCVIISGEEAGKFFFKESGKLLNVEEAMLFLKPIFSKDFYYFKTPEEYQRDRKRIIESLSAANLGKCVSAMTMEIELFKEELGEKGEFDIIDCLGPLTLNIASHAFLGEDFRDFFGGEYFDTFQEFNNNFEFITPHWMPTVKKYRCKKAFNKLFEQITNYIEHRRALTSPPDDFFQALVSQREDNGEYCATNDIACFIITFIWAGHEQVNSHLSWAILEVLMNDSVKEKVTDEASNMLDGKDSIAMADIKSLEYIDAVINETERVHPIAYISPRVANDNVDFQHFTIKKSSMVLLAPLLSHREQSSFNKPFSFNPERYLNSKTEQKKLQGFGGGLHRCIGVHFARTEMKLLISELFANYDMELLSVPTLVSGSTITATRPSTGIQVSYKKKHASLRLAPEVECLLQERAVA